MDNKLIVKDYKTLQSLPNHAIGEIAYCEKEQAIYQYTENQTWEKLVLNNEGIDMNIYDLNKQIISQLDNINISKKELSKFEDLHRKHMNIHYMLLCKDYNYYTLFESDSTVSIPTFATAVADIIVDLGNIKSVETTEDEGAIEIWIQPKEQEEVFAFYLFPYDSGVVYYG